MFLLLSTIHAVSTDCPNVIQFAYNLGVQSIQPLIWTQLQNDCCTASDVTCVTQRVTEIDWDNKGLNGFVNGTAIPPSLTFLGLGRNVLKGHIPSLLPVNLDHLSFYGNQMIGDVPSLPSTLRYVYLGAPGYPGNHFTGAVMLNRPIQFYINSNWITDVVIQDSSVLNPNYCDLSNNPLLGNPNIVGLTMCTKSGLYSASLLPNTKTTSKGVTSSVHTLTSLKTSALPTESVVTTVEVEMQKMETTSTLLMAKTNTITTAKEILVSATRTMVTSMMTSLPLLPLLNVFTVNLTIMIRIVINAMILAFIVSKTPFRREMKRMLKKKKTKEPETSNMRL